MTQALRSHRFPRAAAAIVVVAAAAHGTAQSDGGTLAPHTLGEGEPEHLWAGGWGSV